MVGLDQWLREVRLQLPLRPLRELFQVQTGAVDLGAATCAVLQEVPARCRPPARVSTLAHLPLVGLRAEHAPLVPKDDAGRDEAEDGSEREVRSLRQEGGAPGVRPTEHQGQFRQRRGGKVHEPRKQPHREGRHLWQDVCEDVHVPAHPCWKCPAGVDRQAETRALVLVVLAVLAAQALLLDVCFCELHHRRRAVIPPYAEEAGAPQEVDATCCERGQGAEVGARPGPRHVRDLAARERRAPA
mmetsp:Transcript_59147/g.158443  ORF Transcript_59147/g.158443 Transcript_59147/m.158443 type:complete len:243 (-) Transcript_59147:567-1295(-)